MKRTRLWVSLWMAALWVTLMANPLNAADRTAGWKGVQKAIQDGQPRTAISNLNTLLPQAMQEKAWPEATRAMAMRRLLELQFEGTDASGVVQRLEEDLSKAPPEMVPVLEALLGQAYWRYFQMNRWRIAARTQTSEPVGNDIRTWDRSRLFAEIERHFNNALKNPASLQRTAIHTWNFVVTQGTAPDSLRPTLYDFIAHEALQFFSSGELAMAKPEDFQELAAGEPYQGKLDLFAPAATFHKTSLTPRTNPFPQERALFLWRELLSFHAEDKDRQAFADADLGRLRWAYNASVGPERAQRYESALRAFVEQWGQTEVGARARADLAELLEGASRIAEAHALARALPPSLQSSNGGERCRNLISRLELPVLAIETESLWALRPISPTEFKVQHKNLKQVHVRAIKVDWSMFLKKEWPRPDALNRQHWTKLLQMPAAASWTWTLPPAPDYETRTTAFQAPTNLTPGFYFVFASPSAGFPTNTNAWTAAAHFWVTDISIVVRAKNKNVEGFVVHPTTGEPIAGVQLQAWSLDRNGNRQPSGPMITDNLGYFEVPVPRSPNIVLHAVKGPLEASVEDGLYDFQEPSRTKAEDQTLLFTDRSLYRPGQIVQYKGLCIHLDPSQNNYSVIQQRNLVVVLQDANGKEVTRNRHQCNDYGSFSGSMTLPARGLLGMYSLRVEGVPAGITGFQVEEYKRPKFSVTLDPLVGTPKLGETVRVKGNAMAYTGAAIDGASVTYRVARSSHFPMWCWWRPAPDSDAQQLAHGTTRTAADGSFEVSFPATPDRSIDPGASPTFHFDVSVDVLDSTGETRSARRSVIVGYTTLEATLAVEEWLPHPKPVEITVMTKNLEGTAVPANGSLTVYSLEQPSTPPRASLSAPMPRWNRGMPIIETATNDPTRIESWKLAQSLGQQSLQTGTNGEAKVSFKLAPGPYKAVFETKDGAGNPARSEISLIVIDPQSTTASTRLPSLLHTESTSVEPGGMFNALWGTGYESGRAFIELTHRGKPFRRFWTEPGRTQTWLQQAVDESLRGGFHFQVTYVRDNRGYLESIPVEVPWSNKTLRLRWESFRSRLEPGQKESWTLHVESTPGRDGETNRLTADAELVATLYDASLDAIAGMRWPEAVGWFYDNPPATSWRFENLAAPLSLVQGEPPSPSFSSGDFHYRTWVPELQWNESQPMPMALSSYAAPRESLRMGRVMAASPAMSTPTLADSAIAGRTFAVAKAGAQAGSAPTSPPSDAQPISIRKNLAETAFFFPQLRSSSNGVFTLSFTLPEALTEWRFRAFAHDKQLRHGSFTDTAVSSRRIMVQPNPPRFLREGDRVEFTAKVSNQTDSPQRGKVRLTLESAIDGRSMDKTLGNLATELPFEIGPRRSQGFSWRLQIPDDTGFLTFKVSATTDGATDGEEGLIPVLSRKVYLTESLTLPLRGAGTREVRFNKLQEVTKSSGITHAGLSFQVVSQPAWYAVMSLPYLMEFPQECAEQTFNRFYANELAASIANSNPKIANVFQQWRSTAALESPLTKNPELKSVLLEETPWLNQAQSETEARRRVGVLFDKNRLQRESEEALAKLTAMQQPDGSWPWFAGGPANDYITLYIATGFGRMKELGVRTSPGASQNAWRYLDAWLVRGFEQAQKNRRTNSVELTPSIALYLYGRTLVLKELPVQPATKIAMDFYLQQAREHWLKLPSRQAQAHVALALHRLGERETPAKIVQSLRERATVNPELGMFWRDEESPWSWHHAPIESQAMMLEVFDVIGRDTSAVEEQKLWLLKQKQTQSWKSTKATADAVYALLARGTSMLASDALVELTAGGRALTPKGSALPNASGLPQSVIEPGTGFYETRLPASEVTPAMGTLRTTKRDAGIAWASVHWQYFQDLSKVTPHSASPLKISKRLYRKVDKKSGAVLEPYKGSVRAGDELVVRLEIRSDRDLEFVHLKDQRGSGLEPVEALSTYKHQDGLGYYASPRDTANHYFIDYLPKGTYVFEYSTRVQLRGKYQSGVAEIQCLYALEFNAHSESFLIEAKE